MARSNINAIIASIGFVLILLGSTTIAASVLPLNTLASHNYQGPSIRYYYATVDGKKIEFGPEAQTYVSFDPDVKDDLHPDFVSEHTDFIVPKVTSSSYVWGISYIPYSWKNTIVNTQNPVKVYQWNITNSNGTITSYIMEEWRVYWVITATVRPMNSKYIYVWNGLKLARVPAEMLGENRYHNMDLYFEISLNPKDRNWYFEDADRVYFAIAKIKLVDIVKEESIENSIVVQPMHVGTNLPLFGATYSDPINYKGQRLNPNVFPEKIQTVIKFTDFGGNIVNGEDKNDVVTFVFEGRLFVIGEWIVKNEDEVPNPDDYKYNQWTFGGNIFNFGKLGAGLGIALLLLGIILLTPIDELILLSLFARRGRK